MPLKDAIMDAVYMQTPCALPFMTSSEHGVCDGDGSPVSDETIASALNAVAKIQTEYYKVKKGTQKEMNDEPSPRPWHAAKKCEGTAYIADVNGVHVCDATPANAAFIEHAVNERDDLVEKLKTANANREREYTEFVRLVTELRAERDRAVKFADAAPHPGSAPWKEMRAVYAERDRIRDIVRRIESEMERCHRRDGGISQELMDAVYEARAALGEGETPTGKGVGR